MNMVPNKKYRRAVFQVVLFFNLLIFACVSFADEEQIQEIIEDNTFTGAAAQLRFIEWKKIDEGKVANST